MLASRNGILRFPFSIFNFNADAYVDCTWLGGEGVTFSDPHSLTTTVSWHSTNTVSWATNHVDLVTTYEGGCAVTNHYPVTVGIQPEPTTTLTLDCPEVLFLNDDPLWDEEEGEWRGGSRTERVYRVTAKLLAPHGTSGTLSLDPEVLATVRIFEDRELKTPLATSRTLSVPVEGGYENHLDFYMSCPELGRGGITAVFTPTNDAPSVSTSAVFRVVEPLRRFVTKEKYAPTGQYVNPSRLVWGTNAVLKVDANPSGLFSPSEVTWSVVTTGACRIVRKDGWHAIVEPIVSKGTAIVEARFNGDAVQPRFVLPIVKRRVIHVRAFKVSAPQKEKERNWKDSEIRSRFDLANQIFSQVGIEFDLHPDIDFAGTENDWVMKEEDVFTNAEHKVVRRTSAQARNLFSAFRTNAFVNVYFLGTISGTGAGFYYKPDVSIIISKDALRTAVAHELGHALGLEDCYAYALGGRLIDGGQFPLWRGMFETSSGQDWGLETQRGFYGIGDTVGDVIEDVLMYGVDSLGEDIPGCWVKGLRKKVKLNIPTDEIHVGADYIRKTDEEVYAK